MPRGGKNYSKSRKSSKFTPKKKKEKFNYHTASYIKERKARNEELENQRKYTEEYKAKQDAKNYESSESEVEEDAISDLLNTFGNSNKLKTQTVLSESETGEEDDVEDEDEGQESELESSEDEENVKFEESETSDSESSILGQNEIDSYKDSEAQCIKTDMKQDSESNRDSGEVADEEINENCTKDEEEQIEIDMQEQNEEDEETAYEDAGNVFDPFSLHLRYDINNELYQELSSAPGSVKTEKFIWPTLGNIVCQIPYVEGKNGQPPKKKQKTSILDDQTFARYGQVPKLIRQVDWTELYVKSLIQSNLRMSNSDNISDELQTNSCVLTPLQKELFSIINNYQDLLYCEETFDNSSQIRFLYCLHSINHVLKTRTKVLHHNTKIQKAKLKDMSEIPDEYRDQGLVRPKVLIVVPFRHSCLKIVEMLVSIFIGKDKGGSVINKKRFMEDFGGSKLAMPKKNPKPEDYVKTFEGNIDETFRIGISVTKKALKLYSDFYSSDIIISSVLGLRMIIGAEGEEERDFDFLASIELLIMDQLEIFYMQNWDHLNHILDHIHLQPKNSHGTDFGRVRSWCVNGWSKYYRQTLLFSSLQLPEINAIFNKKCHNYAGKVKVVNPTIEGVISQVVVQIPQVFHRFNTNDHVKAIDARFEFFTTKILPQFKDSIMNHTLVFVPSYFDYVKLRNYFRKEELSFVQICEYTKDAKVARARDMFFHSDAQFLLYTERFHFYRRVRVKGIRHIIFYAPPVFPHFYSEMCNLMQDVYQNQKSGSLSNMTITVIYCKYDVYSLSAILDTRRAGRMINSDKTVHMVMTGG